MASLPQDPEVGHSLWLQRRSTRRTVRRAQWRSDWTPVWLVLLLLGLLVLLSVFRPTNEAVERVKEAIHDDRSGSQDLPVVGVLAEP
jgi:di/tricarboxylate transporter